MNPVPPFDDLEVRRALAMALDRKGFIDILTQGQGDSGGAMQPLPEGRWACPRPCCASCRATTPTSRKPRQGPRGHDGARLQRDKPLKLKLATRNLPTYRDASVILISQLKEIFIDAELQLIETALWVPKLIRRDYQLALSQVGNGVDDPDQNYPENYACGSRTYMDYCNKEIDALIARQSAERDQEKRKTIAWEIDRKLTQDAVRADDLLHARRHLRAARSEEHDDHGEQHLQRLAHGRCLAGSVRIECFAHVRGAPQSTSTSSAKLGGVGVYADGGVMWSSFEPLTLRRRMTATPPLRGIREGEERREKGEERREGAPQRPPARRRARSRRSFALARRAGQSA